MTAATTALRRLDVTSLPAAAAHRRRRPARLRRGRLARRPAEQLDVPLRRRNELRLAGVAAHLLERLGRQAVRSGDPALAALHDELAAYPAGGPAPATDADAAEIAVPLRVRHGEHELTFISTVTTFGTAIDITVSELSIASFFPADAATAELLRAAAAAAGG